MQRWLLVCSSLRLVRLLAFAVYYVTAWNQTSLAQVDDFQSASSLTPQIALHDLELESMFANLFHGHLLSGQSLSGEKRPTTGNLIKGKLLKGNQWISPRRQQHARKVNQRAKKDKPAKWVARTPQPLAVQKSKQATSPTPTESKNNDSAAKIALGKALSKPRSNNPQAND